MSTETSTETLSTEIPSTKTILPKHVFVLVLENRSFDHLLGFSKIEGTDPNTGTATQINGITDQSNSYNQVNYPATAGTNFKIGADPGHEFPDVFTQIYGSDQTYDSKTINQLTKNMSGFAANFMSTKSSEEGATGTSLTPTAIMSAYDTKAQLPILYSLASEFVVCDNWFSSIPGPTWPNRFFIHGASSMGLDTSPTIKQMALWDTLDGFKYTNGSIYDSLDKAGISWKIYSGSNEPAEGSLPVIAALKGIDKWSSFDNFEIDLTAKSEYPYQYTFIEPNYGYILDNTYEGGTSQHPIDDIRGGELLIKKVYETLRDSPIWSESLLVITYDEHGGFYDHVTPPSTVPPGDSLEYSEYGFDFTQLGVRVPALLISPLIKKNLIDHTEYEHSSILKSLEELFSLPALTQRDAHANSFLKLFTLTEARDDTPVSLPDVDTTNEADPTVTLEQKFDLNKASNLNGLLYISQKMHKFLGLKERTVNGLNDLSVHIHETLEALKPKGNTCKCVMQ